MYVALAVEFRLLFHSPHRCIQRKLLELRIVVAGLALFEKLDEIQYLRLLFRRKLTYLSGYSLRDAHKSMVPFFHADNHVFTSSPLRDERGNPVTEKKRKPQPDPKLKDAENMPLKVDSFPLWSSSIRRSDSCAQACSISLSRSERILSYNRSISSARSTGESESAWLMTDSVRSLIVITIIAHISRY